MLKKGIAFIITCCFIGVVIVNNIQVIGVSTNINIKFDSSNIDVEINKPPYPPSNPIPKDNSENVNIFVNFTWNCSDPDDDPLTYKFCFTIYPSPGVLFCEERLTKNYYNLPFNLDCNTKYLWQISAYDDQGHETIGPWWTFTTMKDNNPPNKPDKPSGKIKVKAGVEYAYTSSTTDIDGDQVFYKWDWGDGTDSGWIGPYNSGKICEQEKAWANKGDYNIKVKAKDELGQESEWSDSLPISIPRNKKFFEALSFKLLEKFPSFLTLFQKIEHYRILKDNSHNDGIEYWGLLIAVGKYLNHPEQDRPSMLKEVEKLYDTLIESENWSPSHIYKTQGENANLENILNGFLWLLQMTDEDDISLVYITTHGGHMSTDIFPKDEADGKDEILVPYEGFDDTSKFLWDDEINFLLTLIKSKGKCVIVDSCYSGGFNDNINVGKSLASFFGNKEIQNKESWNQEFIMDLSKEKGRVILMSCEEDEVSYGSDFTYYISKGLKGYADSNQDDVCTAEEAYYYAEPFISAKRKQHPTLMDTYEGELQITEIKK